MSFDLLDRLRGELPDAVESWLCLAIVAVAAGCVVWVVVRVFDRKKIADLSKRLELRDEQHAHATVEIEGLERNLESLAGERRARQDLEVLLASLREQLANAHGQLLAAPRPPVLPVRESGRQAKFRDLFGSGGAIDGRLTKEEAERLILALHELADLMKSKAGWVRTRGLARTHSGLDASIGASWWGYVSEKGIPHAIDLVTGYRADVIAFANSLEAVVARQPDLEFRLRKIVGNVGVIADLLNVTAGFVRRLERLNDGEKYKPAVVEMALDGPFQTMFRAQKAVDEWMQLFVEQRAPAVQREAAAFL